MERVPAADIAVIIIVIVLAAAAIYTLYPPTPQHPIPGGPHTQIIISTDFGAHTLLRENVIANISVMAALQKIASVKTAYGGKFVVAINNITSNPQKYLAWFYYVNGILANVGATEYIIHKGDVIRWDFHYWGNAMLLSAEIQDFPYMLTNGYSGKTYNTTIAYDPIFKNAAITLHKNLKNLGLNCTIVPVSELTEKEKGHDNLILISRNSSLVTNLFNNYKNLGLKYRMSGDYVVDWNGTRYHGDFAEAIQSPFNPKGTSACENVLIIISGTGNLEDAINALTSQSMKSFWYTSWN
ncbi:MAG: DUF4430 domain-containing protein [Euryarchaeota archaeon]|nr:DUF4430 domain-containing protein [Euryarchaeota archaeon]